MSDFKIKVIIWSSLIYTIGARDVAYPYRLSYPYYYTI